MGSLVLKSENHRLDILSHMASESLQNRSVGTSWEVRQGFSIDFAALFSRFIAFWCILIQSSCCSFSVHLSPLISSVMSWSVTLLSLIKFPLASYSTGFSLNFPSLCWSVISNSIISVFVSVCATIAPLLPNMSHVLFFY